MEALVEAVVVTPEETALAVDFCEDRFVPASKSAREAQQLYSIWPRESEESGHSPGPMGLSC